MKALYKKELQFYLNNPIGYIIIVLFGAVANFMYVKDIFLVGSASLRSFFEIIPWLFLIFIPALSMRSFSEERKNNTLEILLTLPISETQIVLAKFFALVTIVALSLLLTVALPVSLAFLSTLYFPEILAGYIGALLLGATLVALSTFFSSLTKNQIIAFVASVLMTFILFIVATEFVASVLPPQVQDGLVYFTPLPHFHNFVKGVIDVRSLLYFFSTIGLLLFLTIVDLERRQ